MIPSPSSPLSPLSPRRTPDRRRHHRLAALGTALLLALAGLVVVAPAAHAVDPVPAGSNLADGIVVKIKPDHTLNEVLAAYPVTLDRALLQSRGIYLLHAAPPRSGDGDSLTTIARQMALSPAVVYAEPNYATVLNSNRYHSWPEGPPTIESGGSAIWLGQPMVAQLRLLDAHALSQGVGVKVAVLDTGVDRTHPALRGRLKGGYDYVSDDADPTDVATGSDANGNGLVDDAYGHGTFVAGLLALVAPDARIMPYRVLNSDGVGNVFVVAQAILDAADAGAKVVNISFGTDQAVESRTLTEAIATVQARGVVVVAAAGNNGSTDQNFPAADTGVLSVSATDGASLSPWANRGGWVKVAAPGDDVVGPVPGGAYAQWSGTSMATPVVAGQIALVRALHPTWSTTQQIAAVTGTSTPLAGVTNGSVDLVASLGGS
jgi:subtilisin family serine protease